MKNPKVLIACEESQRVCMAFRERGIEAYSCDIQEPSGGHPEWHICGDVIPVLEGGIVTTMDGQQHEVRRWDLIIAHPPCTYLTVSGNRWFDTQKYGDAARKREKERFKAIVFFMRCILAPSGHIAVENPIGIMGTAYGKATQIIQPYMFGHKTRKSTCLWLKNLPKLVPTEIVKPIIKQHGFGEGIDYVTDGQGKVISWSDPETAKARSKTFPGIADAMAKQWGDYLLNLE